MTAAVARTPLDGITTRVATTDDVDVGYVVQHWLDSYRRGAFGRWWLDEWRRMTMGSEAVESYRRTYSRPGWTRDEIREFREQERERVLWHMGRGEVTLACDVDAPRVAFGFACTTGDVVHYALVDRDMANGGFNKDLYRVLLGERMRKPCAYTSEQTDMIKSQLLPGSWSLDGGWYFRHRGT